LNDDLTATTLSSLGPDAAPFVTELAPESLRIVAAACDSDALVVALVPSETEARPASDVRRVSVGAAAKRTARRSPLPAELRLCPYRRPCQAFQPPDTEGGLTFPVDVARMAGTTVVAMTAQGIVRVASTRDDGGTWTPFSVAFDAAELAEDEPRLSLPGRLLALGERLLLYGGARRHDHPYFVLVSDDQGASFRAP
jgi:hypothetical protein